MKAGVHLWQYLGNFFLEWETFRPKFVAKIKRILYPITFCRKSLRDVTRINVLQPGKPKMTK